MIFPSTSDYIDGSLAIRVAPAPLAPIMVAAFKTRDIHGYMVHGHRFTPWKAEKWHRDDRGLWMILPPSYKQTLVDYLQSDALQWQRLTEDLAELALAKRIPTFTHPSFWAVGNDGSLLVPEGEYSKAIEQHLERDNQDQWNSLMVHGPLEPDAMISFLVGIWLSMASLSTLPWQGQVSPLEQFRAQSIGIDPAKLSDAQLKFYGVAKSLLLKPRTTDFRLVLSPPDPDRMRLQEGHDRSQKALKRSLYWKKNGRSWTLGALVFLVMAVLIGPIVLKELSPPETVGLDPRQVVTAYSQSISFLDFELLEDTLAPGVDQELQDYVFNLHAIYRARAAYEGDDILIDAQTWRDEGSKPVTTSNPVRGYAYFQVVDWFQTNETSAHVVAEYEFWQPDYQASEPVEESTIELTLPMVGYAARERFTLEWNSEIWQIVGRETLSKTPLDPEQLRLEQQ